MKAEIKLNRLDNDRMICMVKKYRLILAHEVNQMILTKDEIKILWIDKELMDFQKYLELKSYSMSEKDLKKSVPGSYKVSFSLSLVAAFQFIIDRYAPICEIHFSTSELHFMKIHLDPVFVQIYQLYERAKSISKSG